MGIRYHSSVWLVLNENNYHPFHTQRVQGLLPADLFTVEAIFNRDEVAKFMTRELQRNNPHVIYKRGFQHRYSTGVLAAIVNNQTIEP